MTIYMTVFNWHYGFPYNFTPLVPGLEMKYACEAAEKARSKLSFVGQELNKTTIDRCLHETRFNVPQYLKRLV